MSLRFGFALASDLMRVNKFSCISWPSLDLLGRNLCVHLVPRFSLLVFFLLETCELIVSLGFDPSSDACFANIHSQVLCCLCIESMVSLTGQKRLHLRWSRMFLVSFAALAQSDRLLPNRRLRQMAKGTLPRSSPTGFTVSMCHSGL